MVGRVLVSISWSDENKSKTIEARNLSAVEGSFRYRVRISGDTPR